jgi:beta-xylosidase
VTASTTRQESQAWRDPARPVAERVAALLDQMTLDEKLAQLASIWMGASDGGGVAPMQDAFSEPQPPLEDLIRHGMGQLTRVFGTRPVPPAAGLRALAGLQERIMATSRFGIPAIAHEECLTGFAAWTATIFPTPLAWGASFDPGLVQEMAAAIGASMHAVGVHQGLAPVLDITRDARWGRTEETISEDPYLAGMIGTAYVSGLQSAGVHATLKHFAGYSASRAGRNMAPVSIGRRELRDVILPPFEMAIRLGGARAVMPAYIDVDGVPATSDRELLGRLLRDELGFDGVVVSDYFAVSFLQLQHAVAGTQAEAAAMALTAGVDVELPSVRCYGVPLSRAVRDGQVPAAAVDRAAGRVLGQKFELGMFDPGWSPVPSPGDLPAEIDLDPPAHRALARRLAQESVILLANPAGALPLDGVASIMVTGPLADDPLAFFGCYSMPRHLSATHPEAAGGLDSATVLAALHAELPQARIFCTPGCDVRSDDRSGFAEAVRLAASADAVVAVLGDEAGMFGRGTSGEGCDATSLRLPGVQQNLLSALADTGTPVIAVLITGRPYAVGEVAGRLAALVQAFFPGEEGGAAIAGVLAGRVVPSGRLPAEMPGSAAGQPSSYLRSPLAGTHPGSSADPSPLFAFGHGLSYTSFEYSCLEIRSSGGPEGDSTAGDSTGRVAGDSTGGVAGDSTGGVAGDSSTGIGTDGEAEISCTVRNIGARTGTEVVQLYLSDPVAQVVRPARWLAGFVRVPLEPGQARQVVFRLHADRTAFCGRAGQRLVEPGEIGVAIGGASDNLPLRGAITLTGAERPAGPDRVLDTPVIIRDIPG